MYDLIVIGAGISGMTSALYALRSNKKVLIIEKEGIGGQIATSPRLENYPAIKSISGDEFAQQVFDQIDSMGAELEIGEVKELKKIDKTFKVTTEYETYESRSVIIATGLKHRLLGVAREEELVGHGVSYCAVCDGAFFKDQDVVVIGDANTALQYAILLANTCKSVHVVTLFDKFFGDKILVDRLYKIPNISISHNMSLKSFNGENEVSSLTFIKTDTKEEVTIPCKGAFVCIGQIPNNDIFKDYVDLKKGYIVVNENMETKTPGLYAAGDCRDKIYRQVTTAINDGAIAGTVAVRYLDEND